MAQSLFDHQQKLYGYTANGKFFTSKLQAITEAGSLSGVSLYFLDDEWANVNWCQEPAESMQQLVDRRCRQIRDEYSHVALSFSGGFDSLTILNGFIRNNIVIDELIFWHKEWRKEGDPEWKVAWDMAQEVKKNHWPKLKLTIYKRELKHLANFYLAHGEDWVYHPGEFYNLDKGIRDFEYSMIKEIDGKNQADNKSVVIEARDKPRLTFENNKWYNCMNDGLLKFSIANSNLQFYYDPMSPEIYVKQCHLMIRWMEKNFPVSHELVHELQSHKLNGKIYEDWNLALGRDPVFLPEARFGTGKLLQNADHAMIKDEFKIMYPEAYQIWENGRKEIKRELGNIWNDKSHLPVMLSQKHYIRDLHSNPTQIIT